MPSPQEVIEGVTRALKEAAAPGGPLEAVQYIIADDSDTSGYNSANRTPAIIIQVSSLTRRTLDQSWTGEWDFGTDDEGNPIRGRVFLKGWQLTLSASIITGTAQGRHNPDLARRALNTRLGTVLSRYDTAMRAGFLEDENGLPLQNISEFRDEGGDPYGTSSSVRQFERDITIQFEQEVSELQWGGTPVIETVIIPTTEEMYGDPEREEGVKGIPDTDRVQFESLSGVIESDTYATVPADASWTADRMSVGGRLSVAGQLSVGEDADGVE